MPATVSFEGCGTGTAPTIAPESAVEGALEGTFGSVFEDAFGGALGAAVGSTFWAKVASTSSPLLTSRPFAASALRYTSFLPRSEGFNGWPDEVLRLSKPFMRFSSRPSTSVLGSLRSLPLAVTGTVSMAAGATPETRSLSESRSRTSLATPASKYFARSEVVGPNCCGPEDPEPLACTCTSTWPRFFRDSTRRELVRVSPVVKEAEKSMVASIRPSTTSTVWVRRRGRLRAAIRKETRLRRAERPRIRVAAPKTARRTHMSLSVGTPKSSSISALLLVLLVARDAAVAHADGAVRPGRDRGVVGDQDEGLLLALVQPDQEVHYSAGRLGVERAGRLVGPHDGGVVNQRAGHRDALLLAAAHLGRAFFRLIREPHHLDGVLGPPPGLLRLVARHQKGQLHVLDRRQDRYEVVRLEDEAHLLCPEPRAFSIGHAFDGLAVDVDLAVREIV